MQTKNALRKLVKNVKRNYSGQGPSTGPLSSPPGERDERQIPFTQRAKNRKIYANESFEKLNFNWDKGEIHVTQWRPRYRVPLGAVMRETKREFLAAGDFQESQLPDPSDSF